MRAWKLRKKKRTTTRTRVKRQVSHTFAPTFVDFLAFVYLVAK